jgi:hypothetical protein
LLLPYILLYTHHQTYGQTVNRKKERQGGNDERGKFGNIPNDLQQQQKHVRKRQPPPVKNTEKREYKKTIK